jgi:hypothetical protein
MPLRVESHCGAFPPDDRPVAFMFDFVNPIGAFEASIGWPGMTNPAEDA